MAAEDGGHQGELPQAQGEVGRHRGLDQQRLERVEGGPEGEELRDRVGDVVARHQAQEEQRQGQHEPGQQGRAGLPGQRADQHAEGGEGQAGQAQGQQPEAPAADGQRGEERHGAPAAPARPRRRRRPRRPSSRRSAPRARPAPGTGAPARCPPAPTTAPPRPAARRPGPGSPAARRRSRRPRAARARGRPRSTRSLIGLRSALAALPASVQVVAGLDHEVDERVEPGDRGAVAPRGGLPAQLVEHRRGCASGPASTPLRPNRLISPPLVTRSHQLEHLVHVGGRQLLVEPVHGRLQPLRDRVRPGSASRRLVTSVTTGGRTPPAWRSVMKLRGMVRIALTRPPSRASCGRPRVEPLQVDVLRQPRRRSRRPPGARSPTWTVRPGGVQVDQGHARAGGRRSAGPGPRAGRRAAGSRRAAPAAAGCGRSRRASLPKRRRARLTPVGADQAQEAPPRPRRRSGPTGPVRRRPRAPPTRAREHQRGRATRTTMRSRVARRPRRRDWVEKSRRQALLGAQGRRASPTGAGAGRG